VWIAVVDARNSERADLACFSWAFHIFPGHQTTCQALCLDSNRIKLYDLTAHEEPPLVGAF